MTWSEEQGAEVDRLAARLVSLRERLGVLGGDPIAILSIQAQIREVQREMARAVRKAS